MSLKEWSVAAVMIATVLGIAVSQDRTVPVDSEEPSEVVSVAEYNYLLTAPSGLPSPDQPNFAHLPSSKVLRVVDGDTVHLTIDGERVSCRLIGIDTPETVHPRKPIEPWGPEASRYLKDLLKGEYVYIQETKRDRYGRPLVYLWRDPDGLFINLEIVRQGHGESYRKYKHAMTELFNTYEDRAKHNSKGLWSLGPMDED